MVEDSLSPALQEQLDLLVYAKAYWDSQPPYALSAMGMIMALLCGSVFIRQLRERLATWREDRHPLLPLGGITTAMPYGGTILGITLFLGAGLQVFGFGATGSFLLAFLLAAVTGAGLWRQLERLLRQVEEGTFAAADFDFFDNRP